MFNMIFENKNGLQLRFGAGTPFTIKEFSGMNPPKALINTNESALVDGGKYNSAKLQMREVNIAFAIEWDAENNRLEIYKVVQSKMPLKIYYISDRLDVFLEGYVENIDFTYFAKKIICTVTVLCPFPYFKVASEVISDFVEGMGLFHFPFASTDDPQLVMGTNFETIAARVENAGNVRCGLTFKLYANGTLSNPKVIDRKTGEYFQINRQMEQGDQIIVETQQGYKKVILIQGEDIQNIYNNWADGSTWLQLDVNGSTFVYTVEDGNANDLNVEISHFDLFEGV